MSDDRLGAVRRAYARNVLASVNVDDARLEDAFAHVRREHYFGPGPWPVVGASGYEFTPDSDPAHLYADLLVGIIPERRLNNGMRSDHASLIAHAAVQAGEDVNHIGAGVGYDIAIFAELVGPSGRVSVVEYDGDPAQRAAENLSDLPGVSVVQGDGFAMRFDPIDLIYVNAGIYPCEGGRDDEAERAIDKALQQGFFKDVKRL